MEQKVKPQIALFARYCESCRAPFSAGQPFARFCSNACTLRAWKAKNPDRVKVSLARSREKEKTRIAEKDQIPWYFNRCIVCDCTFGATRKRLACSIECEFKRRKSNALALLVQAHSAAAIVTRCEDCLSIFSSLYGHSLAKLCLPCSVERLVKLKRESGNSNRARARRRGLKVERFDEKAILERDRWTCQLCGIKTPKRLRNTYNPRAPEVDHIVTLAQGGHHTPDNVQCACRACNSKKGMNSRGQPSLDGFGAVPKK